MKKLIQNYFRNKIKLFSSINNIPFAETVKNSNSVVFINIDKLGFITEASHTFCLLIGYDKNELMKKNIIPFIQDTESHLENTDDAILNYLHSKNELKWLHKMGHYISMSVTIEKSNTNNIETYTLILHDITEIDKKYFFELDILTKVLNLAKNAIYATDNDNNNLFYNSKFINHWSISPESSFLKTGTNNSDLLNYILNQVSNPEDFKTQYDKSETSQQLLNLKDGRFYQCCISPILENEEKVGKAIYFRNITSEKIANDKLYLSNQKLHDSRIAAMSLMEDANKKKHEAEEILKQLSDSQKALKNSEERFRNLVEKSNEWFWEIDINGVFTYSGPQVYDILGYKNDEIIGARFYDFFPSLESWRIFELIDKSTKTKSNILNVESYYYHRNDEKRIVELFANPIINKENEVEGHRGLIRDITLRKQSEELLKISKEKAEQATKAKSIFLANMGHEIRTPLNAVIGTNYLLSKTSLDSKQRNYIERIEISAKLLLGTINDILDFSKIEAGALTLEEVEFNINEVARNISNIHAPAAQQKGLDVLVSTCLEAERLLLGDPLRMEQILNNLVSNAIKFTEEGHILIKVESVRREGSTQHFDISVRDTGIGIAPENIDKLFSEFVQEDSSTTRHFGGTGLGLSICKKLTEMMGGEISISSELGKGTTFKISMPFTRTRKVTSVIERIDDLKDKNILIVSQIEPYCNILIDNCRFFGKEIIGVGSLEEAISRIKNNSLTFDIVLIDERSDFEQIESLYQISKERNISLILALKSIEMKNEFKINGENCFKDQLLGPFSPVDVYNSLIGIYDKKLQIKTKSHKDINIKNILGNIRILIVEDNPVNQEVAREILEGMGAIITIASNGKEASDRNDLTEQFDVILMDVQMPVMDGFMATKIIREEKKVTNIPILALTASIDNADRETAYEIGINDYLVKPLDPENMMKTILKWTGHEERLRNLDSPEEMEDEDELKHLENIEGFDYKASLKRIGGSKVNYIKYLKMFIKDKSNFRENASELIKNKKWKKLKEEAHSLAGVAGLLGATRLYGLSKELEDSAKKGDIENIIQVFDETCKVLDYIFLELKKTIE